MPGDVNHDPRYLEGIRQFNDHDFYSAHDCWEDLWLETAPGDEKEFLQGLILSAVALHHYTRSNHEGTRSRFRLAEEKLEALPTPFWGINLKKFLRRLNGSLHHVLTSATPPPLDLKTVPSLRLEP